MLKLIHGDKVKKDAKKQRKVQSGTTVKEIKSQRDTKTKHDLKSSRSKKSAGSKNSPLSPDGKLTNIKKVKDAVDKKKQKSKLTPGETVYSKQHSYKVRYLLGSGGFGDVYCVQQSGGEEFAMKTEYTDLSELGMQRLQIELTILSDVSQIKDPERRKHFVELVDRGRTTVFKFIVMTILSLSLEDLRKKVIGCNFSRSTSMQCAIQVLQSIWDLHEIGYMHRDIKPANFAIGLKNNESIVYMLDFGIGRRFRDEQGVHRKPRSFVKFVGTIRFASRSCHDNKDQSRKDDLEVWLYMTVDLFDDRALPWKSTVQRTQVRDLKQQFFEMKFPSVFAICPGEFKKLIKYIDKLKYADDPDYKTLMDDILNISREEQIDLNARLDWMSDTHRETITELRGKKEERGVMQEKEKEREKEEEEEQKKEEEEEEEEEPSGQLVLGRKGAKPSGTQLTTGIGTTSKNSAQGSAPLTPFSGSSGKPEKGKKKKNRTKTSVSTKKAEW